MSLLLNRGTIPEVLVKTHGTGIEEVFLGDYEISMSDFMDAAHYVLTNSDLKPNDPRRGFVERVKTMREVDGYNAGEKRFAIVALEKQKKEFILITRQSIGMKTRFIVQIPNEGVKPFWIASEARRFARIAGQRLKLKVKDETK